MTQEEWKPVIGYEGSYEVSNLGRVRSLDRINHRGSTLKGKILKPSDTGRYYQNTLYKDAKGAKYLIHRLVLEAFVGPPGKNEQGCHNDGDSKNNHLSNLRWDTPSANNLDKVAHGTHPQANKEECLRGHPLIAPNLVRAAVLRGDRMCKACLWARNRSRGDAALRNDMQRLSDDCYVEIIEEVKVC